MVCVCMSMSVCLYMHIIVCITLSVCHCLLSVCLYIYICMSMSVCQCLLYVCNCIFYIEVFFPLPLPRLLPDLTVYMSSTTVSYRKQELAFPSRAHEFTPVFDGVCVAHLLSFLCCPIMCLYVLSSVLWCPLRFPHKNDVRFVSTSSC